jgi:hypothetical protein
MLEVGRAAARHEEVARIDGVSKHGGRPVNKRVRSSAEER